MTLREILNENSYYKRNYWNVPEDKREKSIISGKTVIGFPSERMMTPLFGGRFLFDVLNIGDDEYEFYVNTTNDKGTAIYKNKENYIGTLKLKGLNSNNEATIVMKLIQKFINNDKISPENKERLLDYYRGIRSHKTNRHYKNM